MAEDRTNTSSSLCDNPRDLLYLGLNRVLDHSSVRRCQRRVLHRGASQPITSCTQSTLHETTIDSVLLPYRLLPETFVVKLPLKRNDSKHVRTTATAPEIATTFLPEALLVWAVSVGDEAVLLDVMLAQLEVALLGIVALADNVKSEH